MAERAPETNISEGLSTIFDTATCSRKVDTFESHSLYYEVHGTGTEKLVIPSPRLNSSSFAWLSQVQHFGRIFNYSMLVFDNRGVGHSGTATVLLDYLGWTGKRELHVVGISLGGMIAQELATRIPERIASLTLAVTTPGGLPWSNLPPVRLLLPLTFTADIDLKIPIILDMVYPLQWLEEPAEGDDEGRSNREVQIEIYRRRILITKPQHLIGFLSQMSAGLTHHVTAQRLRYIAETIPKVLILTGDEDNLVAPSNSRYMKSCMPDAELEEWKATGHALHVQRPKQFNKLLERVFKEGRSKAGGQ
ncbi:Alpha/Beta hydrolase protein [Mycena vulgaris]|nr:Alpha/Beta hydrolase protein [Mycena vulgaris]